MKVINHVDELRQTLDAARRDGKSIGFVPTMGFLHAGHRALMAQAKRACDLVVVSIFVNPLQFGVNEDLAGYPRDFESDIEACTSEGVEIVFHPSVEEMYPTPMRTVVTVTGLTDRLCGASRPTHFAGVATVVAKLFGMVGPCDAFFGKKDYQQVAVVKRLVRDLSLPVNVVECPTVREDDGLAMSSRNTYLDVPARQNGLALSRSLFALVDSIGAGERNRLQIESDLVQSLGSSQGVTIDYAEVLTGDDLTITENIEVGREYVAAVAARVGAARLIDNVSFTLDPSGKLLADLGALRDGLPFVRS